MEREYVLPDFRLGHARLHRYGILQRGGYADPEGLKPALTLGEKIRNDSNVTVSTMHSVIYLAFLAVKTGELEAEDALGDQGIVHRVAHWLMGDDYRDYGDDLDRLGTDLQHLQHRVERHFEDGKGVEV